MKIPKWLKKDNTRDIRYWIFIISTAMWCTLCIMTWLLHVAIISQEKKERLYPNKYAQYWQNSETICYLEKENRKLKKEMK